MKKPSKRYVIKSVLKDWENDINGYNKTYKGVYKEYINKGVSESVMNILSYIDNGLTLYHKGGEYQYNPIQFGEYGFVLIKNVKNMKNGFYFTDEKYIKYISQLMFEDIYSGKLSQTKIDYDEIQKKCFHYVKSNNVLYLSVEEFIYEFTPSKYLEIILIWNIMIEMGLTISYEEDTKSTHRKHHTNSHHTVNGFWKNQPYGSRKNPKYKKIWIDSFERGSRNSLETV